MFFRTKISKNDKVALFGTKLYQDHVVMCVNVAIIFRLICLTLCVFICVYVSVSFHVRMFVSQCLCA